MFQVAHGDSPWGEVPSIFSFTCGGDGDSDDTRIKSSGAGLQMCRGGGSLLILHLPNLDFYLGQDMIEELLDLSRAGG